MPKQSWLSQLLLGVRDAAPLTQSAPGARIRATAMLRPFTDNVTAHVDRVSRAAAAAVAPPHRDQFETDDEYKARVRKHGDDLAAPTHLVELPGHFKYDVTTETLSVISEPFADFKTQTQFSYDPVSNPVPTPIVLIYKHTTSHPQVFQNRFGAKFTGRDDSHDRVWAALDLPLAEVADLTIRTEDFYGGPWIRNHFALRIPLPRAEARDKAAGFRLLFEFRFTGLAGGKPYYFWSIKGSPEPEDSRAWKYTHYLLQCAFLSLRLVDLVNRIEYVRAERSSPDSPAPRHG